MKYDRKINNGLVFAIEGCGLGQQGSNLAVQSSESQKVQKHGYVFC